MPRKASYQFDLFAKTPDAERSRTPQWLTLPAETRRSLTALMARLILDHAGVEEPEQRARRDA